MVNGIEVIRYNVIDSTNDEAKRLLENGKTGDFLVTADEQTAGRGRRGKSFYSPPLTGLYFTLVFHPSAPPGETVSITAAAAVAVCRAIETLTDKKPQIKWVNDICLDGKKICGILAEVPQGFMHGAVAVGIGLNMSTAKFPAEAGSAGSLMCDVPRETMLEKIVEELYALRNADCAEFIDYYRERSLLTGKKISIIKNSLTQSATAVGIDGACGLTVRYEDGKTETLTSGEVSIRY